MMTRSRALVAAIVFSSLILCVAVVTDRATGLRAVYFIDSAWTQPVDLKNRSHVTTEAVMADAPSLNKPFSVQWSGYLYSRQTGRRSFAVPSDGSTALFIDGQRLFGEPGVHSGSEGVLTIDRGVHSIVIWYAHLQGRPSIDFRAAAQDEALRPVPTADLSPFRHLPLTYESFSLIRVAAWATVLLWLSAGVLWLTRHLPRPVFVFVAVVSTLFLFGVVYDWPSWLRGPAPYPREWQWGYEVPLTTARWRPAALAALTLLGVVTYLRFGAFPRSLRARALLGLTCATFAGAAFQIALLHFEPDGAAAALTQRTLSDDFTSYFRVAADNRMSVAQFLATYAAEMPRRDRHATSHPPGPILYYRAIITAFRKSERAAAGVLVALEHVGVRRARLYEDSPPPEPLLAAAFLGGFGVALCAALTAWPVAVIAKAVGTDVTTAAQAGALWAFCPSPALFSPQFDQVVTFLVASTCALGCMATNSRSRSGLVGAAFAAGAIAGLAVFCSFGAVPMLGAAGVVAAVLTAPAQRSWKRLVSIVSLAALGFGVISAVPVLAGYDLLTTAREALAISRYDYMVLRGYWLWLRFNLLDFSIFLGLPLVAWGLAVVAERSRHNRSGIFLRPDLVWAVAALVLALDLSGVTRGEIARLWMPLMPMTFVALLPLAPSGPPRHPAGPPGDDRARPSDILAWQLFLGTLLAIVCIVLRLYWNPA